METESSQRPPKAVFMAFGTKGDVHPIAAIAAAFTSDQPHYYVVLITHSAHQNLSAHLGEKNVSFFPISTPPVLSAHHEHDPSGFEQLSFSTQKKVVTREHRQQCLTTMGRVFGDGPSMEGDFIVINLFALEGWNLAELFQVRCVVAAPYVVPYSAPSSFERQFKKELPLLYSYLQEAPTHMVCWKDVIHWMWPLFTEEWGSWRSDLNLSRWPFTDPVTGLPMLHNWAQSPLLLYGFSSEVVECPGYWPSNIRVCGFWFPPIEWQFSCNKCREVSALVSPGHLNAEDELCLLHADMQHFLKISASVLPIFIGLSSIGRQVKKISFSNCRLQFMGFLKNPRAFLRVLEAVTEITDYKFVLFSAGYELLDAAIRVLAGHLPLSDQKLCNKDGVLLFNARVFCFSGTIPYKWLFQRCGVAIHHGGSGTTAAALHAGIPQVVCPFILDQFYWAERMFWLGVAPEPLQKNHLIPDKDDDESIFRGANVLLNAINSALSPKVKLRAAEIADRINLENGVREAVKVLKEEIYLLSK
ncbi:UDP-glucuronosyl/UDP-glucosyltransferase [Macleaya cordata]|uniref:UDP-glucuronosyl/UDP-glucosyltransferase n=1 Tax=Macleaya cordata TaxID=56857 RepID=A0A200QCD1_MACCD|nr:UDP-glucuronosyl/UDP-glucosyltransferase [Macleaya cordata]